MRFWFQTENTESFQLKDAPIPYGQDIRDADSVLVDYFGQLNKFSCLWNTKLFKGKRIIHSQDLVPLDTRTVNGSRDIIMAWIDHNGNTKAILGLEIQTIVDYGMPVRIMGYDYDRYKKSINLLKNDSFRMYQNNGEYLYKTKKEDRIPLVLTMVLNCSDKRWDGHVNIQEMIIECEELKDYYPNYSYLIFEVSDDVTFYDKEMDKIFNLVRWIQRYGFMKLQEKDVKLTREQAKVVFAFSGKRKILKFIDESDKEEISMCEALDWLENRGEQRGIEKGIQKEQLAMAEKIKDLYRQGIISEEAYHKLLTN